jgi:hypothetical protein
MSREPLATPLEFVRRLAVTKQHLSGKLPSRATTNLLDISAIFVVLDLSSFAVSRRLFHREEILTRWK